MILLLLHWHIIFLIHQISKYSYMGRSSCFIQYFDNNPTVPTCFISYKCSKRIAGCYFGTSNTAPLSFLLSNKIKFPPLCRVAYIDSLARECALRQRGPLLFSARVNQKPTGPWPPPKWTAGSPLIWRGLLNGNNFDLYLKWFCFA